MGSVPSHEEVKAAIAANKRIEAELTKERQHFLKTVKILLLGPSEVGKSTILKQMRLMHCKGFTEIEYNEHKWTIFKEMLRALILLTQQFLDEGNTFIGVTEFLSIIVSEYKAIVNSSMIQIDPDVLVAVRSLLGEGKLQAFRDTFGRTNEDATFFFLDHAERICADDYVPSIEDLLNLRIQTTGVVEVTFPVNLLTFRVFDVGGQKSLRRKWLHVFENVNSIMFLCALSDYNLIMREDSTKTRMADALQLCGNIFNSRWFAKSALILFMNKKDIFEIKLKTIPLKKHFPEYKGDNSYGSAASFLEQKFVKCLSDGKREIFLHRTCATDTNQMTMVINSCISKIASDNMTNTAIG